MEEARGRLRRWIISTKPEGTGSAESYSIPLVWRGVELLQVMAANQLLVQVDMAGVDPDMILLTIGHASPPPVIGTVEEQAARLQEVNEVEIQPIVRLAISERRLSEWVTLLQQTRIRLDDLAQRDKEDENDR